MPPELLGAIREHITAATDWTFDHPTKRVPMEERLRGAGVDRYFALPYAHKPDIARDLNEWVLDAAARSEMAVPFAAVHGDDQVADVVRDAFIEGARGLKIQCPVQGSGPDDPRLAPAFDLAAEYDRPVLFHVGTAPVYQDDPNVGAAAFESFVASYPEVRVCAAHMGAYETDRFLDLAREHEQVFLDTTMAMAADAPTYFDFDPDSVSDEALVELSGSVMFGSDFPNIPYDYGRERAHLVDRDLPREAQRALFDGAADRFLTGVD